MTSTALREEFASLLDQNEMKALAVRAAADRGLIYEQLPPETQELFRQGVIESWMRAYTFPGLPEPAAPAPARRFGRMRGDTLVSVATFGTGIGILAIVAVRAFLFAH